MADEEMHAERAKECPERNQLTTQPRLPPAEKAAPRLERLAEVQSADPDAKRGDRNGNDRQPARAVARERI